MDIEGSPRTVIAIPIRLGNVLVIDSSKCGGSVAVLGNHSPLSAWRNDNWGGCNVCGVGHDVPRKSFVVIEISRSKAYALFPICDAGISNCEHLEQQELREAMLSALTAS